GRPRLSREGQATHPAAPARGGVRGVRRRGRAGRRAGAVRAGPRRTALTLPTPARPRLDPGGTQLDTGGTQAQPRRTRERGRRRGRTLRAGRVRAIRAGWFAGAISSPYGHHL